MEDIDLAFGRVGQDFVIDVATSTVTGPLRKEIKRFLTELVQRNNVTQAAIPWAQVRTHVVTNFLNVNEAAALRTTQKLILECDVLADSVIHLGRGLLTIRGKKWPIKNRQVFTLGEVGSVLLQTDNTAFNQLIRDDAELFSTQGMPHVRCVLPPMKIETTGPPICQPTYRTMLLKRNLINEYIDDMLEQGIIRPSVSPWSSPITLVPKKDSTPRFCVDYHKLNAVTVPDQYPLPLIQDIFDQIGGSTIFSTLDLNSAYWQIPMDRPVFQMPSRSF